MATNIRGFNLNGVYYENGNGVPSHVSAKGTVFTDLDYGILYVNKNGISQWGVILDSISFTGGTSGSTGGGTSISAFTYNNANTLTIIDSTGGTFTASVNTMTGLTVNGSLSATTYLGLPIDIRVTGGTYSNGTLNLINNTGGTFNVSGFASAENFLPLSGGTVSGNTGFLLNLSASTFFTGDVNLNRILYNLSSCALIQFSGFSFVASATTYNVAPVTAYFPDNGSNSTNPSLQYLSFPASTGNTLSALTAQNVTYIAINSGGTLIQSATPFTDTQRRTMIPLGLIIHSNRTFINAVNQTPVIAINPLNQLSDFFSAIGYLNLSGNLYSANGANLNINKSAGQIFKEGSNWINDNLDPHTLILSAQTALTFRYRNQNGVESGDTTSINPNQYDLNGVPTNVGSTKFTVQRIALFQSNITRIQFGQKLYNSMSEAIEGIDSDPFITEQNIAENGLLRGLLIIKGNTSDLTDTNRVKFIEVGKFGQTTGIAGQSTTTLQQAYNNSVTPQIVTDSTLGAVTIRNGGVIDANVFSIQNSGGTQTAFITGTGNFSGNSISANTIQINQQLSGTAITNQIINCSLSDHFSFTLSGNTIFTFSGFTNGSNKVVAVTQSNSTSGLTSTFSGGTLNIKYPYNIIPVQTPTTGTTDIYTFLMVNNTIFGTYAQSFY